MKQLIRIWQTVKYLKPMQIYYQLKNKLFSRKQIAHYTSGGLKDAFQIKLAHVDMLVIPSLGSNNRFMFLNKEQSFEQKIDWNFSGYGKLWTYNLTYFDYLNQASISKAEGVKLIKDFINSFDFINDGLEPYPVSLRVVNWIKFITKHKITDSSINGAMFSQFRFLQSHLEYHLLGNHLLENGFSLLFGAYYFLNRPFYDKAKLLLTNQLREQILKDGGHFELSPMYHKILLFRLLDSINMILHNAWQKDGLLVFLIQKAQLMLGWLEAITYRNGTTPNLNDSTNGIAPSTEELVNYAKKLNIHWQVQLLQESGYRLYKKDYYELLVDIGKIGADYIAGHAHADTFNFELMVGGKPIIVDSGISTYEKNKKRALQRSTLAHNTVLVNSKNQSDVWGGFRVGKRAKIMALKEAKNYIKASHNGYKNMGVVHSRLFEIKKKIIIIKDFLEKRQKRKYSAKAIMHFHPAINVKVVNSTILIKAPPLEIKFSEKVEGINLQNYEYCKGFNETVISKMAVIKFSDTLTTFISIK